MTHEDIDRAFEPLRQHAADRLSGKLPPPDLAEIERNTRAIGARQRCLVYMDLIRRGKLTPDDVRIIEGLPPIDTSV